MSNNMSNFDYFFKQATDWLFRRKSNSRLIFITGSSLLGTSLLGSLLVSFSYYTKEEQFSFWINTSDSGLFIQITAFIIAIVLMVIGLIGFYIGYKNDLKNNSKKQIIIIEQRGLRDTSDTPLADAIPADTLGQRQSLIIDIRDKLNEGKVTQPEQALKRILTINESLTQRCLGHATSDVSVIYGGLLPVPFTFLTGLLLDDERKIEVYDWNRQKEAWQSLNDKNDHELFTIHINQDLEEADEAVIAVSASYLVDLEAIKSTFTGLPLIHLQLDNINSDNHWSEEKQAALSMQFFEQIKQASAKGIKKVHLIIVAPNSVVFRLGRSYDKRNLPEAIIYQYERTNQPAYPWGIRLPTHGIETPKICYRSKL